MKDYPFYHSRIEIDSGILRDNARYLHKNLRHGVLSAAVVKADAYGHGAVAVARTVREFYDLFAVANVTEATALRKGGITGRILVFGVPLHRTATAYIEYDLEAVVSSESHFDLLLPGTSYHVEIDSGMGRLGLQPDDPGAILKKISKKDALTCRGIMTHFASADERDTQYMDQQKKVLSDIRSVFEGRFPMHAANSAASLDHPDTHLDMVRHGIALYGYDPSPGPTNRVRPAMKWKSWVAQCKFIRKGQSLSYGATWQAPEDGYYAVVPTGYADGYRRNLSGRMPVLIDGEWHPQAGRVTMDYIMAWLGGRQYREGTEVLVMGGERNHAGLWADAIGTIPYEICCGIHTKVPRSMI